jgi:4-diphosphocytidyl-2-C-methyl-D-erythritol kinase
LADRDADVRLVKHIPPGAGLGGGSSDAAAVLRWAGYSDLAGAATIGADVPYCLAGGRARVGGIGERVEPLEFITETFTLLTPPVHAVTAYVYRVWDEMGGPTGDNGNDLEPAALAAYPELDSYRARLHELSGLRPRLAGSGSTWFVPGAFEAVGTKVVSTIR